MNFNKKRVIPKFMRRSKIEKQKRMGFGLKFVVLSAMLAFGAIVQGGTVYLSDSFRGTSADSWTFVTGQGDGAVLTAAQGIDSDGDGWLRLTKDDYNQSSFVYYNQAIPTNEGLIFTFDFVIWGAHSRIADGFTLAIFDPSVTPGAGAYGGSLGYAQRTDVDGLDGGIAGFGFDVFGNYSRASEGRQGGYTTAVPNAIAVRGSMGEDRSQGYEYITGTETLTDFSTTGASSRTDAVIHTARITLTVDRELTIEWKPEGGQWETLIDAYECSLTCPEEIMFGYTAGTGSYSANHEIRNLSVTAVPEPTTIAFLGLGLIGLFRRKMV